MNNVLFGVIGLLMLAITGVGFTEVKGQIDSRRVQADTEAGTEADRAVAKGDAPAPATKADTPTQAADTSVSGALAEVTRKVTDAVDDVSIGWSHDDGDDDEDDGEDDEDDDRPRTRTGAAAPAPAPTAPAPAAGTGASATIQSYTMAQVASHNSAASCWSAINANVYDLTSFISQHPGGQAAIKSLCGVDGSAAFNGQHGGQSRPASELASLKIGALAK